MGQGESERNHQLSERLLGVFGGSFDPPHHGHLVLAEEAYRQLNLEKVLWVLTPQPPHKPERILQPVEERLKMVQMLIKGNPEFELSRVDIDRPPPHYAVDTVQLLAQTYPQAGFVYLIGEDSLRDLPTWHEPQRLVKACTALGVMRRTGNAIDWMNLECRLPGISNSVRYFDTPPMDISSSDIRSRIAAGRPFAHYLHPQVYEYIIQKRLYVYN